MNVSEEDLTRQAIEVTRYHTDFESIRSALDEFETDLDMQPDELVRNIRNIVGLTVPPKIG